MPKLVRIVSSLIGHLPFSTVRKSLYRVVLGYKFGKSTSLKYGAVISVRSFVCGERVILGRGCQFVGPMDVWVGQDTYIGRSNIFECGLATELPSKTSMNYSRTLRIGNDCLVADSNYFDVYGLIQIGDGTWIAGRGSQFWTHGASVMDRDITIGRRCYVGSMVGFTPGAGIEDDVVVGMGAIVTRRINQTNVLIGGVPAEVIRERRDGDLSFSRWDASPKPA